MNTTESLEAITDRGKFELLVTSVLRGYSKEYEAIINTGINAKGEPIKSPVDGFCRDPESSRPHFIIVEVTTTDKKSLSEKWLNKKNGDLVKAGRLTKEILNDFPSASFTVILATNQRPDLELLKKIYKKAGELKVNCDIWDQSRLTDFMDNTPEGHWLRNKYLGIEAELLSESLLKEICENNISNYKRELFCTDPDHWISRDIDDLVKETIEKRNCTIQFLVGESGFGKSVAMYRALQNHLKSEAYGLWIPAELINDCLSLDTAIDKVLRDSYPYLQLDSGKNILRFMHRDSRFLIVIDDANRVDTPTNLVKKVLSWLKPSQQKTDDSHLSASPHLVLCPLWPQVWESIGPSVKELTWIHTTHIGPMSLSEGTRVVQIAISLANIEITDAEARTLAEKMGGDPFMIGLFSSQLSNTNKSHLINLAEDVIEQFIKSSISEASSASATSYLPADYNKAISALSSYTIRSRRLYPSWEEVETSLGDDSLVSILRELIKHSRLCSLTNDDKFVFRHDRILEFLQVISIKAMFSETDQDPDILAEPYFAEIIGQAIERLQVSRELLGKIRDLNPLALFIAIRYFGTPRSLYHKSIVEEVIDWAKNNVATNSVSSSTLDAVCWSLFNTDSKAVLDITNLFPKYPLILLAGLRNGCAASGAEYCIGKHGLSPSFGDSLRDQTIDHSKRRHKGELLKGLKSLLGSPDITDEMREGALALAGFLGFTDLKEDITSCWDLVTDKTRVLPEAIWAATQCCGTTPDEILDPLIAYWANLPDEYISDSTSLKGSIADALHFALARGISDDVIGYLINQCDIYESLSWPITYMCDRIDIPDAIEFIVQKAAHIERDIAGTERFSPWVMTLRNNWDESIRGRRLSQQSLARLKDIWGDAKNDDFVRRQAFRLWLTGVSWDEIDILRAIPQDSLLFKSSLSERARLGDHLVVPDLIPYLEVDTYWFTVAHHVWCKEIMALAERQLESFKDHIPTDFSGGMENPQGFLYKLLMKIPKNDTEEMLERNWGHLGYSRWFVQTALYVGTPKCLALAKSSISKCPKTIPILEHLSIHFGFMEGTRMKFLTVEHLNNLLPYLDRLNEHDLREIAEVCERLGIPEWTREHLVARLTEDNRRRYCPSDEDLLEDLNEFAIEKYGYMRVRFWLEEFERRHDPRSRPLEIVDRWLESNPTVEGLGIAAECLRIIANREDLDILDKFEIDGPPYVISEIVDNTKYVVQRRVLN